MWQTLWQEAGGLSPTCREAARLQSEALDRRLGLGQRLGLRLHLLLCKWCRRYGKQLDFLRAAAHRQEQHEHGLPPQPLRPEARARILRRLLEAGK